MVDWYQAAHAQSQRLKQTTSAVKKNAEGIYHDLWNEIKRQITELQKDHNLPIYTNGSHLDRVVGVRKEQPLIIKKDRELHVRFEGDAITATAPGMTLRFGIVAGDDEVVRLTHDGAEKTMQGASVMILRQFLFPELYPTG